MEHYYVFVDGTCSSHSRRSDSSAQHRPPPSRYHTLPLVPPNRAVAGGSLRFLVLFAFHVLILDLDARVGQGTGAPEACSISTDLRFPLVCWRPPIRAGGEAPQLVSLRDQLMAIILQLILLCSTRWEGVGTQLSL